MGRAVQNALSPEEKPVIENIISLFQQLLSMQEAQAPAEEEEVITEADEVEDEENDELDMEEIDVTKSSDGETGDDPAEKRIEEVTPTTDDSLADLKKSIDTLVKVLTNKDVKKAMPVKKSSNNELLTKMAKLLTNIVHKQSSQEQLNKQLMEAIGFTDEIVAKSLPKKDPGSKTKPIQNIDSVQVAKDIITEVFKAAPGISQNQEYQNPFNQKRDVRKNLRTLAEYVATSNG